MAYIVSISDFVGEFQLQQDNNTESKFDLIRDEHSRTYVRRLLGAELGNLFLTDLDANGPTALTARFQSIYDAFEEDFNYEIIESKGLKFFIKSVVWFYYARQNNVIVSLGGNKAATSQNSEPTNNGIWMAHMFNKGVETANAIQWYILQNASTYPEFNGQRIPYNFQP